MEISPISMLWLLLWSFGFGALCGGVNDINRLARAMMGVKYGEPRFQRLYEIKLPILGRALGRKEKGKLQGAVMPVVFFLQDVFLFTFAGVGSAVINYYFNYGRLRIYAPLMTVLGFIFYYFTVGRAFLYVYEPIVFAIRGIFSVFLAIIYCPVQFFVKNLVKISKKIYKNIYKALVKKKKMVYNKVKERFVIKNASSGFVDIAKK